MEYSFQRGVFVVGFARLPIAFDLNKLPDLE
jgi:hypothetical protein